jgi:hypothetical protein
VSEQRRELRYDSEDDVIADVQRLRRGHRKLGNWSLSQTCHHLAATLRPRMQPGPFPPNTPEQDVRRPALQQVLATGKLPGGIEAPPFAVPPADAGDSAIDAFIDTLTQFKNHPGPLAPHRVFGNMPDANMRRLNLIHCAHHLSNLIPTT